jgi:class I lanthipeptide synthase
VRQLIAAPPCDEALAAAVRVGEPLRALPARALDRSLAAGAAGLAVCFAHLAAATGDRRDIEAADRYLDIAVDQVAADPLGTGVGLFAGLSGVAWAEMEVVHALGDAREPNEDLDALLAQALAHRPWPGAWDLVSGLVGLGVYALARPPASEPDLVGAVVRALAPLVRELAWTTDSRRTFGASPDTRPARYLDLGLAHGVPGAIALLVAAAVRGCADARELLPDAVAVVLAQELKGDETLGRFPAATWPGRALAPSRLAWCYGDLGVASVLLPAADLLADEAASAAGARALSAAAARTVEGSGVIDAALCHGTAGVAVLFARLAGAGDGPAASAARAWRTRLVQEVAADRLPDQPGLLEGRAGVVLALLSLAGAATGWESALLVGAAPVRAG